MLNTFYKWVRSLGGKYLPPPLSGLESPSEGLPPVELERLLLLLPLLVRT